MTEDSIFVVFDDGVKCAVNAHAKRYADANYAWPEYVIWADGSRSFAKGWRNENGLCAIGAGAYGDMPIVRWA